LELEAPLAGLMRLKEDVRERTGALLKKGTVIFKDL
jgi:hypothetical protein